MNWTEVEWSDLTRTSRPSYTKRYYCHALGPTRQRHDLLFSIGYRHCGKTRSLSFQHMPCKGTSVHTADANCSSLQFVCWERALIIRTISVRVGSGRFLGRDTVKSWDPVPSLSRLHMFVCVEQMTVVTSRAFSGVWQSKVVFSNSTDKYNRFRLDFSRPRLSSTLAYWRLPLTFVQSFRKCDRTLLWMSGFEWGLVTVPFVRVRVRVSFIVIKAGFLNAEFGSLCKIMFKHLLVAT